MRSTIRSITLLVVLQYAPSALALPAFNIVSIGLTDPEHTRNDGYEFSSAYRLNDSGQVIGTSSRFNGSSADLGRSAWLYDGTKTVTLGLAGPEHTRSDGYRINSPGFLNDAGQVAGLADRYNGGNADMGQSVWLYDGTEVLNIGLTGAEFTRGDGYKYSTTDQLSNSGRVSGRSYRYNGGSGYLGASAWLYENGTTINIGLTGAEYTSSTGRRDSTPGIMNEAGQLTGYSSRFAGTTDLGATAWLYGGGTTVELGLIGSQYVRSNGYKASFANVLNQSGQAAGVSYRYDGNTPLGQSTWLYNGTTTVAIGLTGPEHTRSDGYQASYISDIGVNGIGHVVGFSFRYNGGGTELGRSVWLYNGTNTLAIGFSGPEYTRNDGFKTIAASTRVNSAGQLAGYSLRFNGNVSLGRSAWLFDGATSVAVGLTGAAHTRNDGYKYSDAFGINDLGQLRGVSYRYKGSADAGRSAWFYNGTTTIDIGVNDSSHTRNDGYQYSQTQDISELGQVSGYSYRYNGGNIELGQDAWLYDPILAQTTQIQLSSRTDGYAYSSIEYLGDDGLALGQYRLFDALNNDLGLRAFYFKNGDGLHDLGLLVAGGLTANGWTSLADAVRADGIGRIIGHGKLASQSDGQMAYLLTAVPEPCALYLAVLGLLSLLPRGSRKRP